MINRSPYAFEDVVEVFERALSSPKGVRIPCETRGKAVRLRSRFNYWRALDRERNREIYEKGSPMHGLSVYDKLELRIPKKGEPDEHILYIEPRSVDSLTIEEI